MGGGLAPTVVRTHATARDGRSTQPQNVCPRAIPGGRRSTRGKFDRVQDCFPLCDNTNNSHL